ncbi:MAG: glycosyltransferase family 2 protein [Planctomycetaceae bacterium]|nr:glycosyltransferase family 2 protein [Planctomycetaceae bacterium]MCB9952055.1 glycosyltransferase family 2 protein [Planctomycetaceae bacterium]
MARSIAAVVIAKNEAENLSRCLPSLSWCDELLVVDDHSEDDSVSIAESCGARVVSHQFESFAKQRNWALREGGLNSDWVLMLDADEVSTPEFASAIRGAVEGASDIVVAFRNCRKTMFLGQWLKYSDGFPVWIMRVVRRGRAEFVDAGHGEVPVPPVDGEVGTVSEPFLHYPFSKGLSNWLQRHIAYAEREAQGEVQQMHGATWLDVFSGSADKRRRGLRSLSRRMPARPLLRFLYQYIWKWGFLEGEAGLTFSRLMACYEAMIVAKRVELERTARGESI